MVNLDLQIAYSIKLMSFMTKLCVVLLIGAAGSIAIARSKKARTWKIISGAYAILIIVLIWSGFFI